MTGKHTPAPWALQEVVPTAGPAQWGRAPEGHGTLESQSADFRSFDIRGGRVGTALFGSGDGPNGLIGLVAHVMPGPRPDGRAEALANAHLIAAAPQLLDSLLAVEWAGQDDGEDFPDQVDCCPNCAAAAAGKLHFVHCELRDSLDAALGVTSPRLEVAS